MDDSKMLALKYDKRISSNIGLRLTYYLMHKKPTIVLAKIAINSNNKCCVIISFIFMTFHCAYKLTLLLFLE